jgi:hypothetical protein
MQQINMSQRRLHRPGQVRRLGTGFRRDRAHPLQPARQPRRLEPNSLFLGAHVVDSARPQPLPSPQSRTPGQSPARHSPRARVLTRPAAVLRRVFGCLLPASHSASALASISEVCTRHLVASAVRLGDDHD